MQVIRDYLKQHNLPERDLYDLPSSNKTFPTAHSIASTFPDRRAARRLGHQRADHRSSGFKICQVAFLFVLGQAIPIVSVAFGIL